MEPQQKEEVSMHHDKCLELARFYHSLKHKQLLYVQRFVEKNSRELNQRIPNNSFFRDFMPNTIGCTLLHVAYLENDINAYRLLLSAGADFTLKNHQGSTVVHQIVENSYTEDFCSNGRFKNPFLAATLFAHYEYRIRRNPRNQHGITHLHAACMANSADTIVELLRDGDISTVNQTVDVNSPYYPGYTPLHFAMRFSELCTLETIKILLKYGADVNSEDKYGSTPLDILLEKHGKIVEMMKMNNECRSRDLLKALVANEKIIGFVLDECRIDDLTRVSKFIVQCDGYEYVTLRNIDTVKSFEG